MNNKKCPDCGGDFENGCLIDQTYGAVTVQRYAKTEVTNDRRLVIGATEHKFEDLRKTMAYRCKDCNRIFLYALGTIQISDLNSRMRSMWVIFAIVAIVMFIVITLISF